MAATLQQEKALENQIKEIHAGDLAVASVSTDTAFDVSGEVPEITVRIMPNGPWNPTDFLSIRQKIREAAFKGLSGRDHHIIYQPAL